MVKEAICILSGSIKKGENGIWHTLDFGEGGDHSGDTCDRWRVIAGSILWKENPERMIIASGGIGIKEKLLMTFDDVPELSEVIKKELIDLGVPEKNIIKENRSNSTYTQLLFLPKILEKEKIEKAYIVSNEWHLSRIKAFFEVGPSLQELWKNYFVELAAAEKVLLSDDSDRWREIVDRARGSEGIKKRVMIELKGVKDIYEGKYKF